MSDKGISFAGNGDMDVSGSMPKAMPSGGLSTGGPITGGPTSNPGMSADCPVKPANALDTPPTGAGTITFAGDRAKD